MDRVTLKQYVSLQKEIKMLDRKIDRLRDRQEAIPTVIGKVMKSSDDFPYIIEHVSVQMDEPNESDEIKKLLAINEARRQKVKDLAIEIEQFVAAIPDSADRQIFEMTYLHGKKQREVAEAIGYSRSRISQIIGSYLKD